MSDHELLVVISEMLRKQDQHSEILGNQTKILELHSLILSKHSTSLETISETLFQFMQMQKDTNEKQFQFNQEQRTFNEAVLDKLDYIGQTLAGFGQHEGRIKRLEDAVFKQG